MRSFFSSILNLIYPHLCLHCKEGLLDAESYLCKNCFHFLELIDFKTRCPICFSLECFEKKGKSHCSFLKNRSLIGVAAAFEYQESAATLIKKFKYGNMPYLKDGITPFMIAQFLELKWPMPDVIIPVPQSFSHWLKRGYNQAELLADSLSKYLTVPVQSALKKSSDVYSQAGLNYEQRLFLKNDLITLKKNQNLYDKVILLVDDVFTTGTTLKRCGEALLKGYPNSIYALTACIKDKK